MGIRTTPDLFHVVLIGLAGMIHDDPVCQDDRLGHGQRRRASVEARPTSKNILAKEGGPQDLRGGFVHHENISGPRHVA